MNYLVSRLLRKLGTFLIRFETAVVYQRWALNIDHYKAYLL